MKAFLFQTDWKDLLKGLNNETRLTIYEALIDYARTGAIPEQGRLTPTALMYFKQMYTSFNDLGIILDSLPGVLPAGFCVTEQEIFNQTLDPDYYKKPAKSETQTKLETQTKAPASPTTSKPTTASKPVPKQVDPADIFD